MVKEIEYRLNIGGSKGNAFYILGLVNGILRAEVDDQDFIDRVNERMKSGDYNNLLRIFKEVLPAVTLYSVDKLPGVDKDLYELADPSVVEL